MVISKLIKRKPLAYEPSLTMVSTWGVRCGIADYTQFLTSELKKIMKVRILPIKSPPSKNPFYYISLAIRACRNSDIIHIQFETSILGFLKFLKYSFPLALIFYVSLLLFGRKKRVFTTLHSNAKTLVSGTGKVGKSINKALANLIYVISDAIIAHTKDSEYELRRIFGNGKKTKVIPHGTFEFSERLDKENCKEVLGFDKNYIITIFGFVTNPKGHDLLLDMMPRFDDKYHLVVAGDVRIESERGYFESLKEKVKALRIQNKVTFLGYVPENKISLVLSATDVAVLPYRSVSESGAVHVLLSHCVPTITSDLPSFKEIEEAYGCLILFKRDDLEDLFKKISWLLQDLEAQRRLSEKCEKFRKDRSWKEIAKQHKNLYLEITHG